MGTGTLFFATPEEQRQRLKLVLKTEPAWCWVYHRRFGAPAQWRHFALETSEAVDTLTFVLQSKEVYRVYLGRRDWGEPIWRSIPFGDELDPAHSRALIFEPSIVRGNELSQAYFTALQRWAYTEAGYDAEPVYKWYQRLKRLWKRWQARDYVLCSQTDEGKIGVCRGHWLTVGAIKWYQAGGVLRSDYSNLAFEVLPLQEAESKIAPQIKQCPEGMRRCERCQGWTTVRMTPTSDDIPCPACQGTGCVPKRIRWCKRCSGSGRVQMNGIESLSLCPACSGIGIAPAETKWCKRCGGSGQIWAQSLLVEGSLTDQICPECGGKGTM